MEKSKWFKDITDNLSISMLCYQKFVDSKDDIYSIVIF
jgi:hypothetical protein